MEKLDISIVLPIESSKHKNFNDLFKSSITSVINQQKEIYKKGNSGNSFFKIWQ